MKWNKFRLKTTTEAEDSVSSMLMDLGVQGIEIEDKIPMTQAEKEQMFVDILPETGINDGIAEKTNLLREVALEALQNYGPAHTGQIYFTEAPITDAKDMSFFAVVPAGSKGEHILNLPAQKAVCLYHHGAYEELPSVHDTLLSYAREQKLTPIGIFRHCYLEGPPQHRDKSKFITQVLLPLACSK